MTKQSVHDEPRVRVVVMLPKSVNRAVALAAIDYGSKRAVIEAALRDFLKIKGASHA